jgi:CRP/FNR family transcriptional regulator, cyclic AMP receptor protein
MRNATLQQDVYVLSGAKRGLAFLSRNDWALIADKATRRQFAAGEFLVERGKRTNGLYLVLNGTAAVKIASPGKAPSLGPGEPCGEISFLDDMPATADVVANEPVEAYFLDGPTLQSLFELFPHLGSRFYHSLALGLAQRLRELISSDPPARKQKP